MKKILFSALMACFALTASAQISEGAPSAKKYTTGNRPTAGTYGLYIGAETDLFQDLPNTGAFHAIPVVNLKYMATDNFELRLGMKFWKQRESLSGTVDANADNNVVAEKQSTKWVNADNQFRPGFAYHFTKSNLLDVYAGLEGIIGWTRRNVTTSYELDGVEGYANARTRGVQFGAGAFIGLQAFIARLPLAIGLEYGISTKWDGALKTRNSAKAGDNDAVVSYTYDPTAFNAPIASTQAGVDAWDGLKARKGAWGNQVRLTLSYYFNR
ncbi:MAG: hypothetical protein IJ767_04830 [Bacteroidaceae bacterium]|nr:hypothetical protein [Bacteroidaceae bacterium]